MESRKMAGEEALPGSRSECGRRFVCFLYVEKKFLCGFDDMRRKGYGGSIGRKKFR